MTSPAFLRLSMPFAVCCALLAGCATPITTLKHPSTGEVARCGGGRGGSAAIGLIGYNLEKSSDDRCVADHEARGFKRTP